MRNSRLQNVTCKIAIIGCWISFVIIGLMVGCESPVLAQELSGLEAAKPALPLSDQEVASDSEDKWALDDKDRMSDEEMDRELFGNGVEKQKTLDAKAKDGNPEVSETPDAKRNAMEKSKEESIPKQSIESYLRSINSLTTRTSTPPSSSLEGIDTPAKMIPPMVSPTIQYTANTAMRFQTPDIYHRPLYFEDQPLERGGVHACRRQPIVSARGFTRDMIRLPGSLRNQSPDSCVHRENLRYSHPGLIQR